ncbi:MAG: hypothetical protein OXN89_08440 [Bryobacterales bacterium]|nr:hypothetical protein [Bryobacterales bacterium]
MYRYGFSPAKCVFFSTVSRWPAVLAPFGQPESKLTAREITGPLLEGVIDGFLEAGFQTCLCTSEALALVLQRHYGAPGPFATQARQTEQPRSFRAKPKKGSFEAAPLSPLVRRVV